MSVKSSKTEVSTRMTREKNNQNRTQIKQIIKVNIIRVEQQNN